MKATASHWLKEVVFALRDAAIGAFAALFVVSVCIGFGWIDPLASLAEVYVASFISGTVCGIGIGWVWGHPHAPERSVSRSGAKEDHVQRDDDRAAASTH